MDWCLRELRDRCCMAVVSSCCEMLATVTDAVGATHQREWNALGQMTAQIDCSQQRTEYAYDRNGYLASVTNALGETTRTQHDKMSLG